VFDAIRWRFIAVVIILAMLVSVISGGLSGIKFGAIMLRALVGGGIFSILAIVLNLVFALLFPGILESEMASEKDADRAGDQIDITIPSVSSTMKDEASIPNTEDMDKSEQFDTDDITDSKSGGEDSQSFDNPDDALDDFPGDFSSDEHSSKGISLNPNGTGDVHAAEDIAKAIHTVISKDEKG